MATQTPSPEDGFLPSSTSSECSAELKKNPAIRRILKEEGIESLEPLGYGSCSPARGHSPEVHSKHHENQRNRVSELLGRILESNPNQYDRNAGALISHGPPIDHWNPKGNPTGPYGIGYTVPGETKTLAREGRTLTRVDMIGGLRWSFAHDFGESHRLAFTTFLARNLGLCDANLLNNYPHLRYIYIPMNWLPDLKPFTGMKSLSLLDMSDNMVVGEEGDIPFIQSLEILSLAGNRIVDVIHFPLNFYIYLNLNYNKIESLVGLTSDNFRNLETLEVRGNRIKTLATLDLPYLKHLWIANNALTSLKGLAGCHQLVSIHARGNQIKSLFGFPNDLHKLQYVNLRENSIEKLRYIRFLGRAPLQALVLIGNACRRVKDYTVEVLACIPTLVRLDKMKLTSCDLEAAQYLRDGRTNRTLPPMSSFLGSVTPPSSPRGDECVPLLDAQNDPEFWNKIHNGQQQRRANQDHQLLLEDYPDNQESEKQDTSDASKNEVWIPGQDEPDIVGSKIIKT